MITLGVVCLVLVLGTVIFLDETNTSIYEATGLVVSLESFPTYVETHPIMRDIPKDASVSLEIGGQSYGIEGKRVIKDRVISEPDISVKLPEGYEVRIGEVGLCTALREAVKDGELTFETHISKTRILTKYYKLIKYNKCFGE